MNKKMPKSERVHAHKDDGSIDDGPPEKSDGEIVNSEYAPPDASDPLVHPGEILMEELLIPRNLTQAKLARGTGLPPQAISEIINGRRSITPEAAVRLGDFFGISPMFFLNVQNEYDVRKVRMKQAAAPSESLDDFQSGTDGDAVEGELGMSRRRPAGRLRFSDG